MAIKLAVNSPNKTSAGIIRYKFAVNILANKITAPVIDKYPPTTFSPSIFIGASQTKELRNAMIVSVGIYIGCALFLSETLGNLGLWISLSIFFGLRAISLFFYLPRIYRRIT